MAIEIKQMLIKSTVLPDESSENRSDHRFRETDQDTESLKQDILADCRALLLQLLREQKER